MKKILACILTVIFTIASLSSCLAPTPWEEGKLKDTFFSVEHLSKYGADDFPIPKLENSYLDEEEGKLYLNLTREEYEDYVKDIVTYLKENEEFTVSGYNCDKGIFGLLIIPIPEYKFAPIDNEHIDYSLDSHLFVFTKEYVLDWYDETDLDGESYISIKWNPTEHASGETHNVELKFESTYLSKYLPCYHGHDFDSTTYPVAGSDKEITISVCKFCKERKQSEYIGGDDISLYTITVVEGDNYVAECRGGGYAGSLYEIRTPILMDADLEVTVNGTKIPKTKTEASFWVYGFIMPNENVEVSITVVGEI